MMKNIVGLVLLAAGIILLIFGFSESQSLSSDVSRFFTGNPTDRSMWLLIGGAVGVIAGSVFAINSARRHKQ